jgi:hypothetical protein
MVNSVDLSEFGQLRRNSLLAQKLIVLPKKSEFFWQSPQGGCFSTQDYPDMNLPQPFQDSQPFAQKLVYLLKNSPRSP